MPKFKVLVEGRNFLLEMDGDRIRHGFHVWLTVEANDRTGAACAALEGLQKLPKTASLNEPGDPPKMQVKEIRESKWFEGLRPHTTGFIWFPDEGE